MNWNQLLSDARYGSHHHVSERAERFAGDTRNEFERDAGRILYSSAFRRLQDKTQVFPLGRNDYVRTRLTHSLEVQNVGRSLGVLVGQSLAAQKGHELYQRPELPGTLAAIVSTACLAHDIGNPPFGHSGEDALHAALKQHRDAEGKPLDIPFEGNAQGFRLLTRIGDPMQGKGLKLTAAVLAAFMKYPCSEADWRAAREGNLPARLENKKFGYMEDDREAAEWVMAETGMDRLGGGMAQRHPLAYLMEAADDLSYLIADVEDAYISGLIRFDAAREALRSMMTPKALGKIDRHGERLLSTPADQREHIHMLRAVAIGSCIEMAAESFLWHEQDILAGRMGRSLMKASALAEPYGELAAFSVEHIYQTPQIVEIEVMGYKVLGALVNIFMDWVENPAGRGLGSKLGMVLSGIPGAAVLPEAGASHATRLRYMLDALSGMTDSYALDLYRRLTGIRLL